MQSRVIKFFPKWRTRVLSMNDKISSIAPSKGVWNLSPDDQFQTSYPS